MREEHDLDTSEIDERDEIDGDEQLCLVWCDTHGNYEWHWLPYDRPRKLRKTSKPVRS